jgi:hypothetical protein
MSAGKFASITANLLTRKGEAQPSTLEARPVRSFAWSGAQQRVVPATETLTRVPPKDERPAERGAFVRLQSESALAHDLRHEAAEPSEKPAAKTAKEHPREPARTEKPRRMFVLLTPSEYERLGIVAIKRDTSRHQLLREALDTFMDWAVEEYRTDCACVSGASCKGSCD